MATHPAYDQDAYAAYNAALAAQHMPPLPPMPPVGGSSVPPPPPTVSHPLYYQQPASTQYSASTAQYSAATAAAIAAASAAAASYRPPNIVGTANGTQPVSTTAAMVGKFNPSADTSKTNLIVNYLPQTLDQEGFKALFTPVGEIDSCKLVVDKGTGQSLGYGFVNYTRPEDAEKAIKSLNGLPVENKSIKVSLARPSSDNIKGANLYVSGLPKSYGQAELEQMFASFGHIITTRILIDNATNESKGVGFVRFDNREEANEAIAKLHGSLPEGCTAPLTVKYANEPSSTVAQKSALQVAQAIGGLVPSLALLNAAQSKRLQGPIHPSTLSAGRFRYSPLGTDILANNPLLSAAAVSAATPTPTSASATGFSIFVYNLSPETEDSILWQLFAPFGAVLNVKVVRDPLNNKCKGYGFVTMTVYEEALAAITHLHGTTLAGRVLQISFKSASTKPKQPRIAAS